MNKLGDKAARFVCALADVYRDDENRKLNAFDKLELEDDLNEDMIAMLMAMMALCQKLSSCDGDLLDFTYMLNRLVVQHLMEGKADEA